MQDEQEIRQVEALPQGSHNQWNRVRLQFMGLALSVSNRYERAPVSLEIALETEFKKRVYHVTAGMIIDPTATESSLSAQQPQLSWLQGWV